MYGRLFDVATVRDLKKKKRRALQKALDDDFFSEERKRKEFSYTVETARRESSFSVSFFFLSTSSPLSLSSILSFKIRIRTSSRIPGKVEALETARETGMFLHDRVRDNKSEKAFLGASFHAAVWTFDGRVKGWLNAQMTHVTCTYHTRTENRGRSSKKGKNGERQGPIIIIVD